MHFPFMHVSSYTCLFTWTKKLENLNANNAMYMNNKTIFMAINWEYRLYLSINSKTKRGYSLKVCIWSCPS